MLENGRLQSYNRDRYYVYGVYILNTYSLIRVMSYSRHNIDHIDQGSPILISLGVHF